MSQHRIYETDFRDVNLSAQDQIVVEHFTRKDNMRWELRSFESPVAIMHLESLGSSIELAEVYARVDFTVEVEDSLAVSD